MTFQVINIGLKPVLTLLKESRYTQPVLCGKALLALLDSLNQLKPEELFDQPSQVTRTFHIHITLIVFIFMIFKLFMKKFQVLNSILDILLTTSCVLGPDFNQPDDGTNMAAVASSSLVAMVLAKGNTGQILKTIYTLLTSSKALESQKILVNSFNFVEYIYVCKFSLTKKHHFSCQKFAQNYKRAYKRLFWALQISPCGLPMAFQELLFMIYFLLSFNVILLHILCARTECFYTFIVLKVYIN